MAVGTLLQVTAAVENIVNDIEAAVSKTIAVAPTNFGDDFRITQGTALFQTRIYRERDYYRSNLTYPRCIVEIAFHHYVLSKADEVVFMDVTMSEVAKRFLPSTYWIVEAGIYDLDPTVEPEMNEGERVGNVVSFVVTASVLLNAA